MNFLIDNFLHSNNKINKKYICAFQGGNNECPIMRWKCINNAKSYVIIMEIKQFTWKSLVPKNKIKFKSYFWWILSNS